MKLFVLTLACIVGASIILPAQEASATTQADAAVQFVKIMDRDNRDVVSLGALDDGKGHYFTTWAHALRRLEADDSKIVYLLQTDSWPKNSTLTARLSKLEGYKTREQVAYGHAADAADFINSKTMDKYLLDSLAANDLSFTYENAIRLQLGLTKRKKS